MAGLLYFLPRKGGQVVHDDLTEAGIGYAFEATGRERANDQGGFAVHCTCCGVRGGPEGLDGLVVADPRTVPEKLIGYYKDRQQWRRVPNGSDVSVGFYADDPPRPEELVRSEALNGHWVELGDGQSWLIPVARGLADIEGDLIGYCALPEAIRLNGDGRWGRDGVIARYRPLWRVATAWWDAWTQAVGGDESTTGTTEVSFEFEGKIEAALTVLAVNYRIGPAEADLLALLTDQSIAAILMAIVDWPTAQGWLEKKTTSASPLTTAGSSSDAGPPAATPATAPR